MSTPEDEEDTHSKQAPHIHLYAEHLHNIRTLSIQASLATHSNKETKATLTTDGNELTLTHDGEIASIKLPVCVPQKHSDATLHFPAAASQELSFRLSVEEKPDSNFFSHGSVSSGITVPWMAEDLTGETEICCASCEAVLVECGTVKQWKDLPSEGWAEMMDFWHCHKPDVPHDHETNGSAGRGINANSKLAVEQTVGLVGPLDILFGKDDCPSLELQTTHLLCPNCRTFIGSLDTATQGYRLRKPSLSISTLPSRPAAAYDPERWLACTLLTAAEAQGVRKLYVSCQNEDVNQHPVTMQLWLFATDLAVSSSTSDKLEPLHVVKMMYRDAAEDSDVSGRLNAVALSEGEVELPRDELRELKDKLEKSAALLPQKARVFQDWRVGLLRRFTESDVAR